MRNTILDAFRNSKKLPWPSSADVLANLSDSVPKDLETFLLHVLGGKKCKPSVKQQRLVSSIGQDICRAVTNAE